MVIMSLFKAFTFSEVEKSLGWKVNWLRPSASTGRSCADGCVQQMHICLYMYFCCLNKIYKKNHWNVEAYTFYFYKLQLRILGFSLFNLEIGHKWTKESLNNPNKILEVVLKQHLVHVKTLDRQILYHKGVKRGPDSFVPKPFGLFLAKKDLKNKGTAFSL